MADLTQEEIDALLRGEEISTKKEQTGELDLSRFLNAEETVSYMADVPTCAEIDMGDEITEDIFQYMDTTTVDALGEIGNICMGNSATTMSTILGRRVIITTPMVKLFKPQNVLSAYHCPFIIVSVNYIDGIHGKNLLILKDRDAAIITDLMMGGEGKVSPGNVCIDELQISAISEIMNQMIGSSATAMSNMLDVPVNISPPNAENIEKGAEVDKFLDESDLVIRISFEMEIEGVLKSKLIQMMSMKLAKDLVDTQLSRSNPPKEPAGKNASAPATKAAPARTPSPALKQAERSAPKVEVKPVAYTTFEDQTSATGSLVGNLGLISDIPLQVTVELGRTKRSLNDVINLGNGSIVMLDRLAGEPVDIIVNGKPVAKGEVVVIEENYGARITEMLAPSEITF